MAVIKKAATSATGVIVIGALTLSAVIDSDGKGGYGGRMVMSMFTGPPTTGEDGKKTASPDDGDTLSDCGTLSHSKLNSDQLRNSATIIEVANDEGVAKRGAVVAIATAKQEAGLRNLSYGDRDSVGLFQQRGAWGSYADRTDPVKSTRMFFNGGQQGQRGLKDIEGWQSMSIAQAAQAVQVSAYPSYYAKHENVAKALVNQCTK